MSTAIHNLISRLGKPSKAEDVRCRTCDEVGDNWGEVFHNKTFASPMSAFIALSKAKLLHEIDFRFVPTSDKRYKVWYVKDKETELDFSLMTLDQKFNFVITKTKESKDERKTRMLRSNIFQWEDDLESGKITAGELDKILLSYI